VATAHTSVACRRGRGEVRQEKETGDFRECCEVWRVCDCMYMGVVVVQHACAYLNMRLCGSGTDGRMRMMRRTRSEGRRKAISRCVVNKACERGAHSTHY
jgi:hypothetical protein